MGILLLGQQTCQLNKRQNKILHLWKKNRGTIVWKHFEGAELDEKARNNQFASNVIYPETCLKGTMSCLGISGIMVVQVNSQWPRPSD